MRILPLKKNREFRQIYNQGRSFANKYVVMYIMRNGTPFRKAGFSISKKLGCAVQRNRLKRLFREIYRLDQTQLISGIDIVFIARKTVLKATFSMLIKAFQDLYNRADICIKKE